MDIVVHIYDNQPRWIKLREAARYTSLGEKQLKELAKSVAITGGPDTESGRGDWIFDRVSLDAYRAACINVVSKAGMDKLVSELGFGKA